MAIIGVYMKNKNMPLVTAVITTYKREAEIVRRSFLSILAQTYENIEIIIVNDYPTDITLVNDIQQIIESYSEKCNVKYIVMNENGGACKARNTALSNANGEYIAFLDDDDEWLPEKIRLQVEKALQYPQAAIIYCNAYIYNIELRKMHERTYLSHPEGFVFNYLLEENIIGSCSFPMFRTDKLLEMHGFREDMPALQDLELYLRLAKQYEAVYVSKPLVKYYIHNGERISTQPEKRILAYEHIRQEFKNDLSNYKKETAGFYLRGTYLYSIAGDMKVAFKYYLLAIKHDPLNVKRNIRDLLRMISKRFIKSKWR